MQSQDLLKVQELFPESSFEFCETLDPMFKEPCSLCIFLGRFIDHQTGDEYDLYYHNDPSWKSVSARYGEGISYLSGMPLARPDVNLPLYVAKVLAYDRGFLNDDDMSS